MNEESTKPKSSRFLRNFVILFLAAVLLLGAVLGTVTLITDARTYARYGGTVADRAAYSYLASNFKFNFCLSLAGVEGFEDTEAFWQTKPEGEEKTYGALLSEGTKNYIRRVLVSAALFDSAASASAKKEARAAAKRAAEEILTYRADGDKAAFNALTAEYGYTYADLEDIALLLYKSAMAQTLFYGEGGANVTTRLADCNAYLTENYTAVHLLFVRTSTTFVYTLDESGNKIVEIDDNGNPEERTLSNEERAEREALIARLDGAIGSDNMTPALLRDEMQKHYATAPEGTSMLYYFADNAAYTEAFNAENGEGIVNAAKKMAIGAFERIDYEGGVCYIYKSEVEENAFGVQSYESYFTDFYQNAADTLFSQDVELLMEDTVFKKRAGEISFTAIPYKNIIRVRF